MSDPDARPEPDRAPGAPHPRETPRVFGHDAAAAQFLDAFNTGRLHHGWLITGPRGVGKATLAWAMARFLLATPPDAGGMFAPAPATSLEIAPDHPVARRMLALSEPGLFLLRRGWNEKATPKPRLFTEITLDEVRKLRNFFALSAPGGGRRVVIVDAADELNRSAENALLKLLEEPPENAFLLLVSHQPMRLLPTIRSRCRELRLAPLGADDLGAALTQAGAAADSDTTALLALAGGSVGEALVLADLDGPATYASLVEMLRNAPDYDRPAALALAQKVSGRDQKDQLALTLRLIQLLLVRMARAGSGLPPTPEAAPGEAALFARLAPTQGAARRWAALEQALTARAGHGVAVNLDPGALILDMIFRINEAAAKMAA